jgi:xanthine dehydrogenase YagT iron-sulfur-binding subunit
MKDRGRRNDESPGKERAGGITRRNFLTTLGVGAVGVAVSDTLGTKPTEAVEVIEPGNSVRIKLLINGQTHHLLVEPRWSLLFVLREHFGLTGTKVGCERGECGACTVLIDGIPRYACMTLAVEADGLEITTIEGLMTGEELGSVQQAFAEKDAFQCGYCTPGQIMAVEGLLRKNPSPDLDEARRSTSGNLCRCGAYPNIAKAVLRAAELRRRK